MACGRRDVQIIAGYRRVDTTARYVQQDTYPEHAASDLIDGESRRLLAED